MVEFGCESFGLRSSPISALLVELQENVLDVVVREKDAIGVD